MDVLHPTRDRGMMRRLCGLLCLVGLVACGSARAATDKIDRSLRETVQRVAVPGTGAEIVVTSYRPRGGGPFPWIVLSHGTGIGHEANLAIGRYRNPRLMHEWVGRGYAVLVPVRRGYGASGGPREGDWYGSCKHPDFRAAGEGAAQDLLATIAWARKQGDLDQTRWMLVGQSSGAFASIYTASKQPAGLVAVLAFAPGRGGDPQQRPGQPCAADQVAALFAAIAPAVPVPVLWFYAENDQFIGPQTQQQWFRAFVSGGGHGEMVVVPPFAKRLGHGVFPAPEGVPLWTTAVAGFFKSQKIALPF